jgi:N-acetylmuramoyl-L-alanine amidase
MRYRGEITIITVIAVCLVVFTGSRLNGRSVWVDKVPKKLDIAKCDRADFRVVLDVGHTAEAHGAISARNVPEYDFNLRLAHEIYKSLAEDGFAKTVLLVTHGPAKRSLLERVTVANHMSASLFLSIHHDSVPDSFLEQWEYEGQPSHFSDRFKGHSLFISYENRKLQPSLLFATFLGEQLKDRGLQYASHYTEQFMGRHRRELVDAEVGIYRYDQLVVLRETQMPAVLLEAGSIINRDEELLMTSPDHQALISTAVAVAVETFCDTPSVRSESGRL